MSLTKAENYLTPWHHTQPIQMCPSQVGESQIKEIHPSALVIGEVNQKAYVSVAKLVFCLLFLLGKGGYQINAQT